MKEELKTTKKRGIARIGLQLLLLFAVILVLYFQLKGIKWGAFQKISIKNPMFLVLSFSLLFFNQGIEYVKWKQFTKHLIADNRKTWLSFLAGLASGFLSPNGWGNVIGRMLYFRKRHSLQIILVTALGNLSQLIPTAVFGVIALIFRNDFNTAWLVVVSLLSVALLVFYFAGEHFISNRFNRYKWIRHFRLMLVRFGYLRLALLALSTLRFLIFTAQFVLLFMAFGYIDIWLLIHSVWIIYILTSFVPSLLSGKILIRETAALFVFQGTVVNSQADIIVICLLIWLFNIVIPSLIGSFVLIPIQRKK